MRLTFRILIAAGALQSALLAQQWEVGALGGYGFGPKWSASTTSGVQADVGFKSGGLVGVYGANNGARHLGGELRYYYRYGAGEVSSGSTNTSFGAHQQTVTYNVVWHFAPREASVRPYIAGGGGARWVQGTGVRRFAPPLSGIATFTPTYEALPVVDVGVGVKMRAGRNGIFRVEFRDLVGSLPSKVVSPAPGASFSGWFHDLQGVVGFGFVF